MHCVLSNSGFSVPMEALAQSEGFHKKPPLRRCWCPHQRHVLIDKT